jgi:hypothetical protein
MHGRTNVIRELRYGRDESNLYLRLDFEPAAKPSLVGMEVRINLDAASLAIRLEDGRAVLSEPEKAEAAFRSILEVRLPFGAFGSERGRLVRVQVSLWQDGLPIEALPPQGWLECPTAEPADWFG